MFFPRDLDDAITPRRRRWPSVQHEPQCLQRTPVELEPSPLGSRFLGISGPHLSRLALELGEVRRLLLGFGRLAPVGAGGRDADHRRRDGVADEDVEQVVVRLGDGERPLLDAALRRIRPAVDTRGSRSHG